MSPLAKAHLTVTQAMKVWLWDKFHVHDSHVRVCSDKQLMMFQPTSVEEQHKIFLRLNLDNASTQVLQDDMNNKDIIDQKTSLRLFMKVMGVLQFGCKRLDLHYLSILHSGHWMKISLITCGVTCAVHIVNNFIQWRVS